MRLLILAFVSVLGLGATLAPAANARPLGEERAIIQRRRSVIVRTGKIARDFPHKKRAVVTYPVVSGLSDAAVLRRVHALFDFKNIFDYSLQEYREDAWLEEFSYVVNHNGNSLLDITFHQSGSGAYPDEHERHFLVNLRDGRLVKAADAFKSDKLAALAILVDRKLQRELKEIADDNATAKAADPQDKETLQQAHENLKFELANLDDFSVSRKGVTFLYDSGLPHVIQAFAPAGKYLFTFAELKPFIKRDGSLGEFIR